jgi:hypothetical protein
LLEWVFTLLAQAQDSATQTAGPGTALGSALVRLASTAMVLVLGAVSARNIRGLEPVIDRYKKLLLFLGSVGTVASFIGHFAAMFTVGAATTVLIWWLERRRRRNPHEKNDSRQRVIVISAAAVTLLAVVVGALQVRTDQATRRLTRFCLLLSFEPTSVRTDELVGAWLTFAQTWHDVFSGVEGVTITPESASVQDFDKFSGDALVKSLKPDLVLRTKVNIPGKSIHLMSRVYKDYEKKKVDAIFEWNGAIDQLQHTALRGAAHLLQHLHTMTDRPLSDAQHERAARNLVQVYVDFLELNKGDDVTAAIAEAQHTLAAAAPITDERIDSLLSAFDVSSALAADELREKQLRSALMSKLAPAR